jgi:iron-sulfur cluster repair protein YtfE (RIC family)
MTTDDARRRPLQGKVDFTLMYAVHDAFHRDLRCLTAAVEAARTADPAVRAGWATFKNQLHVHHTAEDTSLWPPLRQKVTRPDETAVLDAMEAEHARIDPLLSQVDASLAASGPVGALAQTLAAHMKHEEDQALPLVEAHLGPDGWAAFRKATGKIQACGEAPSSSPGCSTAPQPTPARKCSACCRHPPGSSTGQSGALAMPAPRVGTPPQPEPLQ